MRLAREAARQAVERSFAMPLRPPGFKDAKVVARFPTEGTDEPSYLDLSTPYNEVIKEARAPPRRRGTEMTVQTAKPEGPRPARRDRAAEARAQRRHPRPLLPEAGDPGPRRFRRRQPRSVAQGGGDRRRRDRLLRRPLHGRDREDPVARKDRRSCPTWTPAAASRTAARPTSSRRSARRIPDHIALTYINCSAAVKALSDIIVTTSSARDHPQPDPEGPEDHLRPRPAPRRLSRAQDRARHAAVAGHLHRPPGLQRDRAAEAEGRASRRAGRRASRMPAAHHRPCRPCRLDQVDPRFRAELARRRRSSSRPSRTSSTRWRRPRRTRPSSACPAATATATATCARTWR